MFPPNLNVASNALPITWVIANDPVADTLTLSFHANATRLIQYAFAFASFSSLSGLKIHVGGTEERQSFFVDEFLVEAIWATALPTPDTSAPSRAPSKTPLGAPSRTPSQSPSRTPTPAPSRSPSQKGGKGKDKVGHAAESRSYGPYGGVQMYGDVRHSRYMNDSELAQVINDGDLMSLTQPVHRTKRTKDLTDTRFKTRSKSRQRQKHKHKNWRAHSRNTKYDKRQGKAKKQAKGQCKRQVAVLDEEDKSETSARMICMCGCVSVSSNSVGNCTLCSGLLKSHFNFFLASEKLHQISDANTAN